MDRSQQTVTKYLSNINTHAAIIGKLFKNLIMWTIHCLNLSSPMHRLNKKNQSLWRSTFFNMQNHECWNCTATFHQILWPHKFEVLEMETDILYLAVAEMEMKDCIRREIKSEWERLWSRDCNDTFSADASEIFSPECAVTRTKNTTREHRDFSRRILVHTDVLPL